LVTSIGFYKNSEKEISQGLRKKVFISNWIGFQKKSFSLKVFLSKRKLPNKGKFIGKILMKIFSINFSRSSINAQNFKVFLK